MHVLFTMIEDGKLDTESDSGEFWVLFGGFAPIGKKVASDDDVIPGTTPAKLYRYVPFLYGEMGINTAQFVEGYSASFFSIPHVYFKCS